MRVFVLGDERRDADVKFLPVVVKVEARRTRQVVGVGDFRRGDVRAFCSVGDLTSFDRLADVGEGRQTGTGRQENSDEPNRQLHDVRGV